jgi:stage V sporulation protein R
MSKFALNTTLPRYLREQQERVEKFARGYGLDFFPVIFEILTYDQMNEIAAYGGVPDALPALALRNGVRAALEEP